MSLFQLFTIFECLCSDSLLNFLLGLEDHPLGPRLPFVLWRNISKNEKQQYTFKEKYLDTYITSPKQGVVLPMRQ